MASTVSNFIKFLELNIYRIGFQRDIISHSRFSKTCKYFNAGPIKTLEIGNGGGPFTLELKLLGNKVTVSEINENNIERTIAKEKRFFSENKIKFIQGHFNNIDTSEKFDQIVFLEVLEHILDDQKALERISKLLKPGGRIIISTPTAKHGLLSNDSLSKVEDGGHVRIGYDGPELDSYLKPLGINTVKREFYGFLWTRWLEEIKRGIFKINVFPLIIKKLFAALIVIIYKLTFWMDSILKFYPNGQITLAKKLND